MSSVGCHELAEELSDQAFAWMVTVHQFAAPCARRELFAT